MDILHYSLGFPPFRRGGMTQYCLDLMTEQARNGHKVALLWPGKLHDLGKRSEIEKKQKYMMEDHIFCDSYEILNPLPVPLMDGIQNPEMYLIKKEKSPYIRFFADTNFQVFHVHTLMGLPAEVLEAAHEKGIKIIFTTHDYFPICPRCNFFRDGKNCVNDQNCAECVTCNQHGLSFVQMKLLQSELYQKVKENPIVKLLRTRHNRTMYDAEKQTVKKERIDKNLHESYQALRRRNIELLEKADMVHFNSTNTLGVYKNRGYTGDNARVISISNRAIGNHKKRRKTGASVRFGYLGPLTIHKGYRLFENACEALWQSGHHNFEAHIFVSVKNVPPYIISHKPYRYEDLSAVMETFDILVAPSVGEETFGFTVLEALSYGIPVIASSKVGAKDLILDGKNGMIFHENIQALQKCMKEIVENPTVIDIMNAYIVDNFPIKTMENHACEMTALYRSVI